MVPCFTSLTIIQRVRHRRPPFWSGILQKRFQHAILVWSFYEFKNEVSYDNGSCKVHDLPPNNGESPYFRSPQQHVPQCERQLVQK